MAKELYGLKILVVDDDVDTRELIDWVLRRAGAEVVSVGSAHEAGGRRSCSRSASTC